MSRERRLHQREGGCGTVASGDQATGTESEELALQNLSGMANRTLELRWLGSHNGQRRHMHLSAPCQAHEPHVHTCPYTHLEMHLSRAQQDICVVLPATAGSGRER